MSKKKSKNRQIAVSFSHEDFEKLSKEAESQDISKAELIRNHIDIDFENKRTPASKRVHKSINPQILYEVNRIGNNLNQIAKNTNEKKDVDIDVLLSLNNIEKMLMKLL